MDQGQYISRNEEVDENRIYDDLNFYYGDYIFDGKKYSIWEFTKKANGEQTFLFSHPQNNLEDECAIYFTLPTKFSVFVNFFKCDIGKGIGRKMLEAFLNYLLDSSDDKYGNHKFISDTKICLKPGKIVDSTRLSTEITFNKDKLIRYYETLGFASENANASELCGPIYWLLYSIENVHNKRTGSSNRKYNKDDIKHFVLKTAQRYRVLNHTGQKTGYVPVTKSKLGGRKKQMTRKKRK